MRLIDAQIEYPALFAKAVDQHTIPFIKIDFPKGNIDLKTLSFLISNSPFLINS
jgi:hypothetical protein